MHKTISNCPGLSEKSGLGKLYVDDTELMLFIELWELWESKSMVSWNFEKEGMGGKSFNKGSNFSSADGFAIKLCCFFCLGFFSLTGFCASWTKI